MSSRVSVLQSAVSTQQDSPGCVLKMREVTYLHEGGSLNINVETTVVLVKFPGSGRYPAVNVLEPSMLKTMWHINLAWRVALSIARSGSAPACHVPCQARCWHLQGVLLHRLSCMHAFEQATDCTAYWCCVQRCVASSAVGIKCANVGTCCVPCTAVVCAAGVCVLQDAADIRQ